MIKKFLDIPRLITGIAFLLIFWVNANAQTLYTDYTPDYKTDYKAYILDKIEFRQKSTVFFFRFVCDNNRYNGATFFSRKGTFPWYLKLDNGKTLELNSLRNIRRDEVLVAATAPEPNFYISAIKENPYTVFTCEIHFPKLPEDVTFVDLIEGKGMEKSNHFNCFNVRVKEEDDKDLGDEAMRQDAIYKFEKRYGIEQNAPMKTEDEMITTNIEENDSNHTGSGSGRMQIEDDLPLPEKETKKTVQDVSNRLKLQKWEDMDCGKRLILGNIEFYDNTAQIKGWVKARQ
ncbi:MAG: hypothetical protein MK212_17040, partial [Saprospiraceae bacterium]|nr:hypothetical protein [Saprospiraceae bacterium]